MYCNSNNSKDNKENDKENDNKKPSDKKREEFCTICLNQINNRSLTDVCRHSFCFDCIRQWSQSHNDCPFCRRIYHNILYNIRSDNEFDQIPVGVQPNGQNSNLDQNEPLIDDQLNQLRIYRDFEVQHIQQLNESLNHSDPNSIEHIQVMQRIANAEERQQESTEMILQLSQNQRRNYHEEHCRSQ